MHDFQILFDHGEHSELLDPVYSRYGKLGFPHPPQDRPWIYVNFVQSLDGLVSLLGPDASGGDISQSEEDRWLMDLLRAHADGILLGLGTLVTETRLGRPRPRGPIFRIADPVLRQLRDKLHRGPERNIFVTGATRLRFEDFAVFDGEKVETYVVTTAPGAELLEAQRSTTHPHVNIVVAGEGSLVDLPLALTVLRESFGFKRLLCEGGPGLYSNLLRQGLIDEKFLTVAPFEAGQQVPALSRVPNENFIRPTIFPGEGFDKEHMVRWEWLSCRKVGDHQFHRFRRRAASR